MCKCAEKPNFAKLLVEAAKKTAATGKQHVVYYMAKVKMLFVGPEEAIDDSFGVCCYSVPSEDGKTFIEKEYVAGSTAKTAKAVTEIEVQAQEETGKPTAVTDAEYKDFVDNGNVSDTRIKWLAQKVMSQSKLSKKEEAMFAAKTSDVEEVIKFLSDNSGNSDNSAE